MDEIVDNSDPLTVIPSVAGQPFRAHISGPRLAKTRIVNVSSFYKHIVALAQVPSVSRISWH